MKTKRFVVILVVLIFSTVGLFAQINNIAPAVATLSGNIDQFFNHGFVENNTDTTFVPTIAIRDAFNADTPPSFWYGYRTNAKGTYIVRMQVSDFINQSNSENVVKIKSVVSTANDPLTYNVNGYELFNETNAKSLGQGLHYNYTQITITAAKDANIGQWDHTRTHVIIANETVDGAAAGEYIATITFTVGAV